MMRYLFMRYVALTASLALVACDSEDEIETSAGTPVAGESASVMNVAESFLRLAELEKSWGRRSCELCPDEVGVEDCDEFAMIAGSEELIRCTVDQLSDESRADLTERLECSIRTRSDHMTCLESAMECSEISPCDEIIRESSCTLLSSWELLSYPDACFGCYDESAIPQSQVCDGTPQCSEGEEEEFCFVCGDGSLVREHYTCDGFPDCEDSSDETNPDLMCPPPFTCGDGEQIPSNWVCDEEEDCADGSDEAEERMCPPPFICDGDYEIPAVWVCDDQPDCEDGTDEQNCE